LDIPEKVVQISFRSINHEEEDEEEEVVD